MCNGLAFRRHTAKLLPQKAAIKVLPSVAEFLKSVGENFWLLSPGSAAVINQGRLAVAWLQYRKPQLIMILCHKLIKLS